MYSIMTMVMGENFGQSCKPSTLLDDLADQVNIRPSFIPGSVPTFSLLGYRMTEWIIGLIYNISYITKVKYIVKLVL